MLRLAGPKKHRSDARLETLSLVEGDKRDLNRRPRRRRTLRLARKEYKVVGSMTITTATREKGDGAVVWMCALR